MLKVAEVVVLLTTVQEFLEVLAVVVHMLQAAQGLGLAEQPPNLANLHQLTELLLAELVTVFQAVLAKILQVTVQVAVAQVVQEQLIVKIL